MTDKDGNLVWFDNYTGWRRLKEEIKVTDSAHQSFRLQNQYADRETGLHYNFLRYYEPNAGRFVNQAPIRLWGGENLYAFSPNIVSWIDPLGLIKASEIKWKGFSKGKLAPHYEKHVVNGYEFEEQISQSEYLKRAKNFAANDSPDIKEHVVDNLIVKFNPQTRKTFIGHIKSREIRTYYISDNRTDTPFEDAVDLAKTKCNTFNKDLS